MNIWENAVITNKGVALLAKMISGTTMNITRGEIGSGYVTPGTLPNQTAVTNPMQEVSFREILYPEVGKCALPCFINNDEVNAGYMACQVGIYATDPDEGEILFFITQAPSGKGLEIPSATEMPGYSSEWTFYFQYGQADGVSVVVDPSNTVSVQTMEAHVSAKIKEHTNEKNPHGVTLEDIAEDIEIPQEWFDINEAYEAIKEYDHKLLGGVFYKDFDGKIKVFPLSPPYGIREDEVGDEYAQSAIAMYNSKQQLLVKPATDDRHAVPLSQLIEKLGLYLAKSGGIMTGKPEIKTSNPAVKLTDTTDGNAAAYFQTHLGKAYFGYGAANSLSVDKEGNAKVVGTLTVGGSISCSEIDDLTRRLNSLVDSDDTTLDQLSEIVAYIKSNKSLIDAITTSKVSVTDIVNDLVTNVTNKPLSAAQGAKLKNLIDSITVPTETETLNFTYEDGTTRTLEVYLK